MSFICHKHNYTEYNEEWNVFSAFNPSKCTHLEQWAADCAAPREQSWTSCQSQDSNPQPWVTSGFKSNTLSIRPRLTISAYILLIHTSFGHWILKFYSFFQKFYSILFCKLTNEWIMKLFPITIQITIKIDQWTEFKTVKIFLCKKMPLHDLQATRNEAYKNSKRFPNNLY